MGTALVVACGTPPRQLTVTRRGAAFTAVIWNFQLIFIALVEDNGCGLI